MRIPAFCFRERLWNVDKYNGIGVANLLQSPRTIPRISHAKYGGQHHDQTGQTSLIARFMGPTWGLPGADRTQVGPMLATWTLLSGFPQHRHKQTTFTELWLGCTHIWQSYHMTPYILLIYHSPNAVSFLKYPHKRHPITRPLWRGIGCFL